MRTSGVIAVAARGLISLLAALITYAFSGALFEATSIREFAILFCVGFLGPLVAPILGPIPADPRASVSVTPYAMLLALGVAYFCAPYGWRLLGLGRPKISN